MPYFDDRVSDILDRGTLQGVLGHPLLLTPEQISKGDEPQNCMVFHFSMWLLANPGVTNFRMMLDGNAARSTIVNPRYLATWVVFGERSDYSAFTRWLRRYRSWFTGRRMEAAFFPQFPTSGRLTLSFVAFEVAQSIDQTTYISDYPIGLFDAWAWIIENCEKPAYLMPGGIAFHDGKEAMMFKLRWCG